MAYYRLWPRVHLLSGHITGIINGNRLKFDWFLRWKDDPDHPRGGQ